jgi:hypothetical protein
MNKINAIPAVPSRTPQARFPLLPLTVRRAAKFASCLAILAIASLSQSAHGQTLIGEWLSGATNLTDASGYSPAGTHDGYLIGNTNLVFTNDTPFGRPGLAAYFNVGDTGVAITNSSTLDSNYVPDYDTGIASAFTVTTWAKGFPGTWSPWVAKFGETTPAPQGGWQLRDDGSVNAGAEWACFSVRNNGVGTVTLGTAVYGSSDDMATRSIASDNGNWHFYAGVFNSVTGERSLYIDGVLAAQETGNVADITSPAEHLTIAAKDSPPGNTFGNYSSFEIYDVRIYNSGLTSNQVLTIMGTVPPVINTQLQGTNTVIAGKTALLSVAGVTGTAPFSYQWLLDGTNLVNSTNFSGVTNATLSISNARAFDLGTYSVIVTNSVGTNISSNSVLALQYPLPAPTAGSFGGVLLTNKPVAFWQLNETNDPSTGTLLAYDYTGNGYVGNYGAYTEDGYDSIISPQPPTYPGFLSGQGALQVNATVAANSNLVTVPALNLPTNTWGVTITAWIFPTAIPPTRSALFFGPSSDPTGFGFGGTTNAAGTSTDLAYTWNNNAGDTWGWNSGLFPQLDNWSFVALVVQSNFATIYLDYIDQSSGLTVLSFATNVTTDAGITPATFSLGAQIGGDVRTAANIFAGNIADVAVFSNALSAATITHLFGEGLGLSGIAPAIATEPVSAITFTNSSAQISVSGITGTAPITYQWQLDGTNISNSANFSGANTNTLVISNATFGLEGTYQLVLTSAFGHVTSTPVTMTLEAPALVGEWINGATNFADVSGYSPVGTHDGYLVGATDYYFTNDVPAGFTGQSLVFTTNSGGTADTGVAISNSSTLDANYVNTYDNAVNNAITVTLWAKGLPGSWNSWVSKFGESEAGWQLRQYSGNGYAAFTVRDNNAGGADLGISGDDMGASGFPTKNTAWHNYAGVYNAVTGERSLYVDGILAADETNNSLYVLAPAEHLTFGTKDSPPGNSFGSYSAFELYDVRVYNYALTAVQVSNIVGNLAPVVNKQPASAPIYVGTTGQLTAGAFSGTPPLYFQWQLDGTNLANGANYSGVTSNVLTLNNVTTNYAGTYNLIVTNAYGQTLSSNAVVTTPYALLVGQWITGATNFADVSGFAPAGTHDGYLIGNTNVIWTNDVPPGKSGYSAYFNAGNTGVAISNSSTLDANYVADYDSITNAFTVMCWGKGLPGGWNAYLSKWGESPPEAGWQLRDDGSSTSYMAFTVRNGGGDTVTLGTAVYGNSDDMATRSIKSNDGKWHHFAGVFNSISGVRSLYIDGVLAANETGNSAADIVAAAEHLCLCAKDSSPGNTFGNYSTLRMYDARIYNYPLTLTQIDVAAGLVPSLTTTASQVQVYTNANGAYYGGQIVLTWPYGTLHETTNLLGPWTVVTNTSPYTNTVTGPQLFFELSNP